MKIETGETEKSKIGETALIGTDPIGGIGKIRIGENAKIGTGEIGKSKIDETEKIGIEETDRIRTGRTESMLKTVLVPRYRWSRNCSGP